MPRPATTLLALLLSGCSGLASQLVDTGLPAEGQDTSTDPIDSADPEDPEDPEDPPDPEVTEETVDTQVVDDSWIFATDRIHQIALEIPLDSWNALNADPYTYATANGLSGPK